MITTNRNKFLGVHITYNLKRALKSEAKRQKISVSHLVFNMLNDALERVADVRR